MRSTAIDVVRDLVGERLPQVMQQLWQHLRELTGKVSLKPPRLPSQPSGALHWISWRTVLAAALLGGIVHILATFVASLVTGGHAYGLLIDQLPANRMLVLPQQSPGKQVLPELPPDMLYAMCRYDLQEGVLAVRATVVGPGWSLSVHTPKGSNFYVLTGQPDRSTDVSFLLVPSTPDAVHSIPRRESPADTQIASPSLEGVVVLRAPLRGLAWTAEIEAILQRASCALLKQ
jgi:uncharacterized membrane protein